MRRPPAVLAEPPPTRIAAGIEVAIVIFEGFSAYDAVGSYELLSRLPGVAVRFLGAEPGPKRTETAMLALTADFALSDLPDPELVVVPGGPGAQRLIEDDALLAWLRRAHDASHWTGSAGAGSAVLAAAGILDAAGHSLQPPWCADQARTPAAERVVVRDRVVTAPGGVELALALAARIAGAPAARALERALSGQLYRTGPERVALVPASTG